MKSNAAVDTGAIKANDAKKPTGFVDLKRQSGFTLIELAVVVGIIASVVGAVQGGKYLLGWYNGKTEGDVIANALNCGRSTWTSSVFTGITTRNMVDNNCFPAEITTGKGSASAAATNSFGSAYTVSPGTVLAANDAVEVTSPGVPSGACTSAIKALAPSASTISVVGGSSTTPVKNAGAALIDSAVATACGQSTTVSIIAAATKSGT